MALTIRQFSRQEPKPKHLNGPQRCLMTETRCWQLEDEYRLVFQILLVLVFKELIQLLNQLNS